MEDAFNSVMLDVTGKISLESEDPRWSQLFRCKEMFSLNGSEPDFQTFCIRLVDHNPSTGNFLNLLEQTVSRLRQINSKRKTPPSLHTVEQCCYNQPPSVSQSTLHGDTIIRTLIDELIVIIQTQPIMQRHYDVIYFSCNLLLILFSTQLYQNGNQTTNLSNNDDFFLSYVYLYIENQFYESFNRIDEDLSGTPAGRLLKGLLLHVTDSKPPPVDSIVHGLLTRQQQIHLKNVNDMGSDKIVTRYLQLQPLQILSNIGLIANIPLFAIQSLLHLVGYGTGAVMSPLLSFWNNNNNHNNNVNRNNNNSRGGDSGSGSGSIFNDNRQPILPTTQSDIRSSSSSATSSTQYQHQQEQQQSQYGRSDGISKVYSEKEQRGVGVGVPVANMYPLADRAKDILLLLLHNRK
eukprot:gene5156-10303_t